MTSYAIGVDLGGTTVKQGLFRQNGELVEHWEIPTRTEEAGRYILCDIAASIREHLEQHGLSTKDLTGVGIAVPGPVLHDGTVNHCVNLGWGTFNVKETFSALLDGIAVEAANDANAAGLGEMWKGGGRGHRNMYMITLGTGVGGALIIHEKIVHGAFGCAGEIGHLKISDNETESCGCGKKGCLEQYCSATGIARMARMRLEKNDDPSVLRACGDKLTAKDLFDAYKAGDAVAAEVAEDFGKKMGLALSWIASVADPEVFVIGGGVSRAGQPLIDVIQKHYRENVFPGCRDTRFALAELGNDAGIYGAVKMVL